jgi:hypothetical protein
MRTFQSMTREENYAAVFKTRYSASGRKQETHCTQQPQVTPGRKGSKNRFERADEHVRIVLRAFVPCMCYRMPSRVYFPPNHDVSAPIKITCPSQ